MAEKNQIRITTFKEFWPFYLTQHRHPLTRKLHFLGTTMALFCFFVVVWTKQLIVGIGIPLFGYGFAWLGHFFVEKNRPATFKNPYWSLLGDFKMWWMTLTSKIRLK